MAACEAAIENNSGGFREGAGMDSIGLSKFDQYRLRAAIELARAAELGFVDYSAEKGREFADSLGLNVTVDDVREQEETTAKVGGSVMVVARGIIVAVVALIVLSALYSTDIVSNPTNQNQWTNMTQTFADYGTTAFTLIGVGLIAVGAGVALSYFGGMGGASGR